MPSVIAETRDGQPASQFLDNFQRYKAVAKMSKQVPSVPCYYLRPTYIFSGFSYKCIHGLYALIIMAVDLPFKSK